MYRFVADNPGVWAFHCHIDWHLSAGFFATIVEAPLVLQRRESVPGDFYDSCRRQGLPYQGNAAGNTRNFTDLKGANDKPPVNNVGYVFLLPGSAGCCVCVCGIWLTRDVQCADHVNPPAREGQGFSEIYVRLKATMKTITGRNAACAHDSRVDDPLCERRTEG